LLFVPPAVYNAASEERYLGSTMKFVIQEHHARARHYDFRLEKNGVLKSWAVPKGVPEEPGIKRLAIAVEDHPLAYADFEGRIAEGNYGAGEVKIWDRGEYDPVKWTAQEIVFVLRGRKVNGSYRLIRFRKSGENNWLLEKLREAPPLAFPRRFPGSIRSSAPPVRAAPPSSYGPAGREAAPFRIGSRSPTKTLVFDILAPYKT
jgi:bifunctional non-homologous end joining protein LigD